MIVAVAAAELVTVIDQVGPATIAAYVLAVTALALRRRWPLAVALVTVPAAVSGYLWLAPMCALGTAAAALPGRLLVYGCAAVMFLVAATPSSLAEVRSWKAHEWGAALLGPALFVGGPTALGRLARTRRELAARLTELKASQERERMLVAEKAITAERARLAREMHDVVSHQVSLISVEAGALALTSSDPRARRSGEHINELGTRTLDELHVMLGALRGTADPAGPPGLADLSALVAASGLAVRIEHRPPTGPLSPEAEHAAYRTVQEALTNVVKHAPGSEVTVTLSAFPDGGALHVEVRNAPPPGCDTGPPAGLSHRSSSGRGLAGLRERASLLGGALRAMPTPDGGFTVHAVLPCRPAPEPYRETADRTDTPVGWRGSGTRQPTQ
ncbi:sensor histidine kinase [Streptomyces sp. NPDC059008]|uniref:sensor histidine kinase n=1 Tax=Streptomyces sp. NPDC059008 TaxID=3346693 RepID=UPI00369C033A